MSKFYSSVFTVLSYIFLAVTVIYIFAFLSASNGEMAQTWPLFIGIELGGLLCAGLCWVLRGVLIYTTRKNEEDEAENEYNTEDE